MDSNGDIFSLTEDHVIERQMERLHQDVVPSGDSAQAETEPLTREYSELLGLIPYELAPMTPASGSKERLMRAVRGEVGRPNDAEAPEVKGTRVPVSRWMKVSLPLAASIAVVLLGVVGWQTYQMEERAGTIEELSERLSRVNVETTNQLAEYEVHLKRMQGQLALVTSRGVEVCTLHPKTVEAADTGARGTLFVASDHQHWYLRIDDLEPCPQGRAYQLWFVMADGTSVNGGILDVEHGVELEVTADTMPDGTVAVNVTLEPAGGSETPSGPSILYGDEVMRLL